jgi:hypothetical protein
VSLPHWRLGCCWLDQQTPGPGRSSMGVRSRESGVSGTRNVNDSCSQRQLRVVNLSPAEPLTDKLHKETRLRECPATLLAGNGFHVDATTPCRFILPHPTRLALSPRPIHPAAALPRRWCGRPATHTRRSAAGIAAGRRRRPARAARHRGPRVANTHNITTVCLR